MPRHPRTLITTLLADAAAAWLSLVQGTAIFTSLLLESSATKLCCKWGEPWNWLSSPSLSTEAIAFKCREGSATRGCARR